MFVGSQFGSSLLHSYLDYVFAFANRSMGKRDKKSNKKLPEVEEGFNIWTLGLPFREYHGIDEVNEKLKLQAFMEDGCYGDEDEIDLGYDTSEIRGGFYIFVMKGSLDIRLRTLGVASPGQKGLTKWQLLLRVDESEGKTKSMMFKLMSATIMLMMACQ